MTGRHAVGMAVAWVAGVAVLVAAESIEVTPVVADGKVSASFSAPAVFDDDAREVMQSGLLLTFTFNVELRRPSAVWLDRTLGATAVASSVKFDNLTSVYQVSKLQDGQVVWSERTDDLATVREWMTRFDLVALVPGEPLEPNTDYYVRVRMQLSPKRTFSFWPWTGDEASGRADFTFLG